ncbi:beta-ketoacyl-[acyl-carrier-protein] synthase family protein [Streptomyces sp. NBC_01294]|uniref:beta-ketoacyl-[acyl-carrier-protein] synthase family protein n=1 Tax=Streptomyces sp. NBC_01294 TaxID=2903815 RepID=UPI002DDB118C|nr:beta-ketoacyl-[acyl-carrier-protein] synthase family protein [Streptomyces sp. NBC_01294]WRZ62344.1 beta-ketoacyl-[acyl-carrier-protein] synthase family protein [Streptomyces sp. NBC_01294]
MFTDGIAVTGIGLVTPAGLEAETCWSTLCAGRSVAEADPALAGLPVDFSCRVRGLDVVGEIGPQRARRTDRFTHLALAAARRAVVDAGLDPGAWASTRIGVVLGVGSNSLETYPAEFSHLTEGRPQAVSPTAVHRSIPSNPTGEITRELGTLGPAFTVSSACGSGATALGIARDLVRAGSCDIVLAGGSESARSRMTATCFAQMRALSRRSAHPALASRPFDTDRDGFVLGEGAALLVLERASHARRRGVTPRAILRGFASTSDAHSATAPHPEGAGAERAIRAALSDAGCTPRDVGHINAHGTSTRLGDAIEAQLLHRLYNGATPPVTAIKGVIGHALGAAAAIEAAITILSLQRQRVPPTANLIAQDPACEIDVVTGGPRTCSMDVAISTSFGFDGHNSVLLFSAP